MVNRRRFIRVAVSDEEDEASRPRRTRKRLRLFEEEEDDDNDNKNEEQQLQKKEEVPESPQPPEDATPIGKPIRFSGKGKGRRSHYESFMFNGIEYTLVSFLFSLILHKLGFSKPNTFPNSFCFCFYRRTQFFSFPREKAKSHMLQLLRYKLISIRQPLLIVILDLQN